MNDWPVPEEKPWVSAEDLKRRLKRALHRRLLLEEVLQNFRERGGYTVRIEKDIDKLKAEAAGLEPQIRELEKSDIL